MKREELIYQIRQKKSFLCVGLDTDLNKIPKHLLDLEDPVFEFNKSIIDATKAYCVSYKLNTAFYEANGLKGWESMQKTIEYIPENIFTIADAKRGDIGNTSAQYAKAFFEQLNFDGITVAPYMGRDSISPFLQFNSKWTIVLGLTSNEGAWDFQYLESGEKKIFEKVIAKVSEWGTEENLMFVVGATKSAQLKLVREIVPNHFLLIPGVGAQGGNLDEVCQNGLTKDIGILVNASRQIIYASGGADFAEKAMDESIFLQKQMSKYFL